MKKYQIKNTIGSGNFSTVYSAEDLENHQLYAVKIMKSHPKIASRQAHFLNKMKHPNVIQLIQFQQNHEQSKLFLQHVGINTLQLYQSHSYGLRQQQVKCILFQTALGLSYIHSFGIIHRDIKPENLLIDKKNALVKIIDFGLAIGQQKISTDYIATRWYRAPENLLGTKQYSTAIDVFSLGCVIVELYLGSPLFPGTNNMDQLYKIFNILGQPTPSSWPMGYRKMMELGIKANCKSEVDIDLKNILNPCNSKLIDLIHKMLILNPKQRITCESIVKHEYFRDIKNIIPPLVYKKFETDFPKINDPLTFRGFHQVKSAKTSIKEMAKSKTKYSSNHFRSQEPRKQKSSSIDSVHSVHNHQRIHPSIIKSVGVPGEQDSLLYGPRSRFNTVDDKNQDLLAGSKNKFSIINKPKLLKNNSYVSNVSIDSKDYSRFINDTDGIKNSKNSTEQSTYPKIQPNYPNKLDKSQQNLQYRNKKIHDFRGKDPESQKSNLQGFPKYNYTLRTDRSPNYLEQIKNLQAPKMIKIPETKNVAPKHHANMSPSNSYHINRLEEGKRKNFDDINNKISDLYSSPRNQPFNALRKQKCSPVLRNSDQGQRINVSPNYQRQKETLNAGPVIQRYSVLNHYKSFDNIHKGSNHQSHLRKSPEITSRNYSNNYNKFSFNQNHPN